MADLVITITDENNDILQQLEVYEDGSDSQVANDIAQAVMEMCPSACVALDVMYILPPED